jgi:hypothetical protein
LHLPSLNSTYNREYGGRRGPIKARISVNSVGLR